MKTPREILFEKHRNAETKLDVMWERALDEVSEGVVTSKGERTRGFWVYAVTLQLWRDLILPSRRVWAGMAGVWVVILGLRLMAGGDEKLTVAQAKVIAPSAEVVAALREQKTMLAQLLDPSAMLPVLPPPRVPGPRGERRSEEAYV